MLPVPSIDTIRVCVRRRGLLPVRASGLRWCMLSYGLILHRLLATNLVLFFAASGQVSFAHQLFESLSWKDQNCWAPLIIGYLNCDMLTQALHLYRKIPPGSLLLDPYTFVRLLKSCAELRDVEVGSILYSQAAESQLYKGNAYVDTAVVDMYAKCGALSDAQGSFISLPAPKTVTWNALLAGHIQHGHSAEAEKLFDCMQAQHVLPDAFTYACVLKSCATLRDIDKGSTIHECIRNMDMLQTDQNLGNALVNMYSKCGLHQKAKEVLKRIPKQSVISWNALIAGCLQHNHYEEVLSCLKQMQFAGLTLNDVTYACGLKACAHLLAINKGKELHLQIKRDGCLEQTLVVGTALVDMYAKCGMLADAELAFEKLLVHDVISWSALIHGYTNSMQAEEALRCFGLMKLEGVSPNAFTFACCLKACGILGAVDMGDRIRVDIEDGGLLKADQAVGNALVDMYTKCGLISKAWEVFEQLPVRNVVTWTAIIMGYAQRGDTSSVFESLQRMRGEDILPNGVTLLAALYACSHTGLVDNGKSLFEEMTQQYGIIPTLGHRTCILDLLNRAGQFDAAAGIIAETPSHFDAATCLACWGHVK